MWFDRKTLKERRETPRAVCRAEKSCEESLGKSFFSKVGRRNKAPSLGRLKFLGAQLKIFNARLKFYRAGVDFLARVLGRPRRAVRISGCAIFTFLRA